MSSLVQQKWMSSARPLSSSAGAICARRFLRKYSTALTSCWVTFSVSPISVISSGPKSSTICAQLRLLVVGERADTGHDLAVGEVDEPLDLDVDPLAVECRLRQVVDEGSHRTAVATVEGAERDGRSDVSERAHGRHSPIAPTEPGTTFHRSAHLSAQRQASHSRASGRARTTPAYTYIPAATHGGSGSAASRRIRAAVALSPPAPSAASGACPWASVMRARAVVTGPETAHRGTVGEGLDEQAHLTQRLG